MSSDASPVNPTFLSNALIQRPSQSDSKPILNDDNQNKIYIHYPRLSAFLRDGRQMPATSSAFLRFGRGGHVGGAFLRFGRQTQNPFSSNFLLSGKNREFLRFG